MTTKAVPPSPSGHRALRNQQGVSFFQSLCSLFGSGFCPAKGHASSSIDLRSDMTAMQSSLLLEAATMIIALSRHLTVADTPNVSNTNGPVSQLAQRIKGSAHDWWAWAGRWRPCDNWKNSKKQLIGLVRCKDRERSQAIFFFPPPRSAAA
jgi:hypothetical protein